MAHRTRAGFPVVRLFSLALLAGCPMASAQWMPEQTQNATDLSTQDQRFLTYISYQIEHYLQNDAAQNKGEEARPSLNAYFAAAEQLRGIDTQIQDLPPAQNPQIQVSEILQSAFSEIRRVTSTYSQIAQIIKNSGIRFANDDVELTMSDKIIQSLSDALVVLDSYDLQLNEALRGLSDLPKQHPKVQSLLTEIRNIKGKKAKCAEVLRDKLHDVKYAHELQTLRQNAHAPSDTAEAYEMIHIDKQLAQFALDMQESQQKRLAYDQRVWFEGDPELARNLWQHFDETQRWIKEIDKKYAPILTRKYTYYHNSTSSLFEQTELNQQRSRLLQALNNFEQRAIEYDNRAAEELPNKFNDIRQSVQRAISTRNPNVLPPTARKLAKTRLMLESMIANPKPHPLLGHLASQYDECVDILYQATQSMDAILADSGTLGEEAHGFTQSQKMQWTETIKKMLNQAFPKESIVGIHFENALWRRAREGYRWQEASQNWLEDTSTYLPVTILLLSGRDRLDLIKLNFHIRSTREEIEWVRSSFDLQMLRDSFEEQFPEESHEVADFNDEKDEIVRAKPSPLSPFVKPSKLTPTALPSTEPEFRPFVPPRGLGH